ncbi:GroES-like protein [Dendrothele bispora CBS 962.96]|uniref:GroES-like protein n=1 Tax=Dendrothele bispora (strain CBS 962.96) TaxID=1314807 RepID=A0A4S8MT50_DENBC|nr:GroES-like protein [Dendrothele bispora CBS 962.96]
MFAICTTGKGDGTVELRQVDVPKIGPKEMLVKVVTAAQNPADWKASGQQQGVKVVGCDYAGIVTQLGDGVTEEVEVGDRIAGMVPGLEMNGAFAEYTAAPSHMFFKLPDSLSFEDASQLGIACYTTCQCLYQSQDLPSPENPTTTPIDILVWGGSSSVGHFVIQVAKLGGMRVIATASPRHFDRLKKLGADEVFDYRDPEVTKKIRASANGKLKHAVDCISEGSTPQLISDSLSPEGGTVSAILEYETVRPEVKVVFSLGYYLFGKPLGDFTPTTGMTDFGTTSSKLISKLLAEGKIVPAPLKIYPNGLADVPEGLEFMKSGKVSGEKIVYRIADTPGVQT